MKMDWLEICERRNLNLKATELRLGLPGMDEPENRSTSCTAKSNKRPSPEVAEGCGSPTNNSRICDADRDREVQDCTPPPAKSQIVGWPPLRSYRKNNLPKKSTDDGGGLYVKVSMDGAPYLRKIDLRVYKSYPQLLEALETLLKVTVAQYSEMDGFNGSDYAPTYVDKDGDWMLLGDVPWKMFVSSCKRLRIMRSSEAKGLSCL